MYYRKIAIELFEHMERALVPHVVSHGTKKVKFTNDLRKPSQVISRGFSKDLPFIIFDIDLKN